ncbi:MAG: leucine-rich repeat protein [Clostridia bacterium]|nr:leucine-rich repeat protein [Clostridia bacterium]
MKKILSIVLTLLLLLSLVPMGTINVGAEVTGGTTGDCTWSLDGTVLTISGNGDMKDYDFFYDEYAPWINFNIKKVIIEDGVTSIGSEAFSNCVSITSITIPSSVISIGSHAFEDCYSLKSVYIEDLKSWCEIDFEMHWNNDYSNPLWKGNVKLYLNGEILSGDVVVPVGTTKVGFKCFCMCSEILSVTIPNSVKKIEPEAFYGCSSLESVFLGNGVESIEYLAFYDTNLTNVWYCGSFTDRAKIDIDETDDFLLHATWHYNNCNAHEYSNTLNLGLTCVKCKYSNYPSAPTILVKTNNSVTLVSVSGFEYRKNDGDWQSSNVFTKLSADTTYTFYQRVKASSVATVSDSSAGLTVSFKAAQNTPTMPIVSSFTDTTVNLVSIVNGEYSLDGVKWQTDNVFNGLLPATNYIFYQRYAETDTQEASDKSISISITTDKSKQTLIPDAPTVQSFTENSITLNSVDGCEYSKDGINWQTSNVFSGLSCGTEYNFYQRYKETTTTYVGKSSKSLVTRTDKGLQTAPSKPTLSSKTHNSITLMPISGYEYSRDGINWQLSNVFKGLVPETNYMFYQRKAESDRYYVSPSSIYLTVKTSEAPECVLNSSLHQYNNTCDTECNICGGVREVTHNYKWIVDKLNNCGVKGVKHEECSVCHAKRSENTEIAATGKHTHSNNCDTKCNVCSKTRTITHTYKTTTTKATISKNGKTVKKCAVCGKVAITTTIKYAKSFKLSTTKYTYNGKAKKPTVTVKDSAGNKLVKNKDYTVSYKNNTKVGKATVAIKLKGNYTGTKTLTFKINPKKAGVSKLTAAKKSLKVKITKQSSQVSGYEIQYSTSKKFTKSTTKMKKVTSYKTTSVTLKSLKAKKTYYVRVRTYKTVGKTKYYSGWSSYKYKKTK